MNNSSIEWTDHTVNFWWGCTKVSPACTHCYAESIDKRFGASLDHGKTHWGKGTPRLPRLEAARKQLNQLQRKASRNNTRYKVFINSMSDWLDPEVPLQWLDYMLESLRLCPRLDFQLLTKRPELWRTRLTRIVTRQTEIHSRHRHVDAYITAWLMGNPPGNVWIGTTTENQSRANQRIPNLIKIPATIRFLSCEPLLGPVNLPETPDIHWVITGGESGPKARPLHPQWLEELRSQCSIANIPFFFKQWGEWAPDCTCDRPNKKSACRSTQRPQPGSPGHMFHCGSKHTGNHLQGTQHQHFPVAHAPSLWTSQAAITPATS